MDEIKAKQQVVEKIKEAGKILVTVSDNPSVDALSAALGLTLLLDKQEKYSTAIFSGETPPAIAFLEPEKTFDDTTDSLRDFIIALNKEKADHLRYKVEGDAVKIFITPYKTTITEKDLEFSQGDYNVELVIALGVDNQDNLDRALENHGQILHDAAIITLTAGDQTSNLGGIDWHDANASSLSEMVAGLAQAMKDDKKKSIIDGPIATALLTGIVAETDRFSNEHTTSGAMTVAATLMSAGADQQLIATELQNAREIGTPQADEPTPDATNTPEDTNDEATISADGTMTIKQEPKDSIAIDHSGETLADLDKRVRGEEKAREKVVEELEAADKPDAKSEVGDTLASVIKATQDAPLDTPATHAAYAVEDEMTNEPAFGGTLNATTDQAEDDARREEASDQNKTILSHAYLSNPESATPAESASSGFPGTPSAAPGSVGVNDMPTDEGVHSSYAPEAGEMAAGTYALGGEKVIQPLGDQGAATGSPSLPPLSPEAAAPLSVPPTPTDLGLPLPPPIPDFSQGMTPPPAIPLPPTEQPAILGDILAPESTTVDNTANAMPEAGSAYAPEAPAPAVPPVDSGTVPPAPSPTDPGQFKIPGQQ
ncbi:MAG TPA: hypothetical protein VN081_06695 [Dongiaceae bacterium]|nr:hypothetical protein [Dongiaceae bacterium]